MVGLAASVVLLAFASYWQLASALFPYQNGDLNAGTFGDSFGAMNAFLSGMALVAISYTAWLQRETTEMQRRDLALQGEDSARTREVLQQQAEMLRLQVETARKQRAQEAQPIFSVTSDIALLDDAKVCLRVHLRPVAKQALNVELSAAIRSGDRLVHAQQCGLIAGVLADSGWSHPLEFAAPPGLFALGDRPELELVFTYENTVSERFVMRWSCSLEVATNELAEIQRLLAQKVASPTFTIAVPPRYRFTALPDPFPSNANREVEA